MKAAKSNDKGGWFFKSQLRSFAVIQFRSVLVPASQHGLVSCLWCCDWSSQHVAIFWSRMMYPNGPTNVPMAFESELSHKKSVDYEASNIKVIGQLLIVQIVQLSFLCHAIWDLIWRVIYLEGQSPTKPKGNRREDGSKRLFSNALCQSLPTLLYSLPVSIQKWITMQKAFHFIVCKHSEINTFHWPQSHYVAQETFWLQSIITIRKEPLKNNNESHQKLQKCASTLQMLLTSGFVWILMTMPAHRAACP